MPPARLRVDAETRRLADPVREGDVEHLHVHRPDVAPNPFLEDVDEEAAYCSGRIERAEAVWPSCTYSGRSRQEDQAAAVLLGPRFARSG